MTTILEVLFDAVLDGAFDIGGTARADVICPAWFVLKAEVLHVEQAGVRSWLRSRAAAGVSALGVLQHFSFVAFVTFALFCAEVAVVAGQLRQRG